jgi:hypothetical protein
MKYLKSHQCPRGTRRIELPMRNAKYRRRRVGDRRRSLVADRCCGGGGRGRGATVPSAICSAPTRGPTARRLCPRPRTSRSRSNVTRKGQGGGAGAPSLSIGRASRRPCNRLVVGSLPYAIQTSAGGGTSLLFTGGDPGSNRLDLDVYCSATSVTLTVYVLMQPGPGVAAGNYADSSLTLQLFYRRDGRTFLVASRPFTVTGAVQAVCQRPPPNVASLDFTSAISNGLPNPGSFTPQRSATLGALRRRASACRATG